MSQNKRLPNLLLKNSFYNILGHILPFTVGLLTIPQLIKVLGMERFGILTIIWILIGYFSLFDFGLSRTITVKISDLLSQNKKNETNTIFWTSLCLIIPATLVGSSGLLIAVHFKHHFSTLITANILEETFKSLPLIAFTLPAVTLTSGIKGALEAENKFYGLNIIQIFSGILNFLAPLWIATYTPDLVLIVLGLSFLRYIFLIVHLVYLKSSSSWLGGVQILSLKESIPLITSGGWFTVSNIVGPIMIYLDRFLIASLIPSTSLAYYTTPFELVNRLNIIPSSITRALFPIIASGTNNEYKRVYRLSVKTIFLICGFATTLGITLGNFGLKIWIGEDFAASSYFILVILLVGYFFNSLAWAPFNLIQAFQKPKLTALIHLIELPFYIVILYILTKTYGLTGAALSWTIRNTSDLIIMTYFSKQLRKTRWEKT